MNGKGSDPRHIQMFEHPDGGNILRVTKLSSLRFQMSDKVQ